MKKLSLCLAAATAALALGANACTLTPYNDRSLYDAAVVGAVRGATTSAAHATQLAGHLLAARIAAWPMPSPRPNADDLAFYDAVAASALAGASKNAAPLPYAGQSWYANQVHALGMDATVARRAAFPNGICG